MRKIRHRLSSSAVWLFLAGLGSMTEVHFFGSIAITELAMFVVGPILFFINFHRLRYEGFMPFVCLTLLTSAGCVLASKVNDTYWLFAFKGLAVPAVYFVATVTFHHLLRRDLSAMKWFLIGMFLSSIVSVFMFQQETFAVDRTGGEILSGVDATDAVMDNALFWSQRINSFLKLPTQCFYFSTPSVYNWLMPIVCAAVSLMFSDASGRAAAATAVGSAALIFCGGKTRRSIAKLGRHFFLLALGGLVLAVALKTSYASLASSGVLGDKAQAKYEKQTAQGKGILNILMAGRMELFCGLFACIDKPIIGWGPKAEDTGGYVQDYLAKYANDEDYQAYIRSLQNDAIYGYRYRSIPAHSHIEAAWLHYGIFGLLLWLYVFWLMYKYIRSYASAIPQWFGYIGLSLIGMIWTILFSPPGGRLGDVFFIVCILFCRAVSQRKITLRFDMEVEIDRKGR